MTNRRVDNEVKEMAERAKKWLATSEGERVIDEIAKRAAELDKEIRQTQAVEDAAVCTFTL